MKQCIYPVFCLYIKSPKAYTRNYSHWRWGSWGIRLLPFHAFWIFIKNAFEIFCNAVSSADVYTGVFFFFFSPMIYTGVTIKIASSQTVAWFRQRTIRIAAGINQDPMGWPLATGQKPHQGWEPAEYQSCIYTIYCFKYMKYFIIKKLGMAFKNTPPQEVRNHRTKEN